MYIAYIDEQSGKEVVISVGHGFTPEQAALAMGLAPDSWREITEEEAEELQKPTPEEVEAIEAREAEAKRKDDAIEFAIGLMEGCGYE